MEMNICKERYHLRKFGFSYTDRQRNLEIAERLRELEALWEELPVEKISIHHYGGARVYDCPALEGARKLFPIKDVYGRYGCTGCPYYHSVYLQYVRCKWRAVHENG